MFNLIARLRTRPIEHRQRIAFVTAFLLTLLIALIWAISLVAGKPEPVAQGATAPVTTPTQSLMVQFKEGAGAFKKIFSR